MEGGGRTVLVVDDDESMRKLLVVFLTGLGFEIDEARNGQEALERSLAREYDVIICDVKMPVMDGPSYYRALRAHSPERAQRVIFATGILPTDEGDALLRSLPNARLQKPFHLADLRKVLANGVAV